MWQYIFFRKFSERHFIVKKNKNFFDSYNVWNNWYPMTHWRNCFYTHERFKLIKYNISFIFTYLLHSGRHSTFYINARAYQQLSAPCLWNLSLAIKKKTHISAWSPCFQYTSSTSQQAFLSVTEFSLYISPYISFSSLCPWPTFCPSWEYYCAGFECRTSSFAKFMLSIGIYLRFAFLFHSEL